jgi:hypothetical protein
LQRLGTLLDQPESDAPACQIYAQNETRWSSARD